MWITPGTLCPMSTSAPASVVFKILPLSFVFGSSATASALSGVVIVILLLFEIMPKKDYTCLTINRQCEICGISKLQADAKTTILSRIFYT
jgi:hypothetical protein